MTLEKYISEAISSGKTRTRIQQIQPGSSFKEIVDYLESLGITGRYWSESHSLIKPKTKNQLTYLVGPWTDRPYERWVAVTNYWGQYVNILPDMIDSTLYDPNTRGDEIIVSFEQAVKLIDIMLQSAEDGHKLSKEDIAETVNEAISSKQNSLPFDLDLNEPEKITDWLEGLGFKQVARIPAKISKSKPDYSIAPTKLGQGMNIELKFIGKDNRTYWGNFKTGSFTYARLLDITDDRNPFPVFTGWNDNRDELTKNIIEFIDENV